MLGTKVRELRKSRQLTLAELATKLGISESYLSQLESEKVDPSISLVRKLAAEFEVSIAVFFDTEYEKPIVTRFEERDILALQDNNIILSKISPSSDQTVLYMKEFKLNPNTVFVHVTDSYYISVFVTEGALTIRYLDTEAKLSAGDSIFLPTEVSIEIANESEEECKGLICSKERNGGAS